MSYILSPLVWENQGSFSLRLQFFVIFSIKTPLFERIEEFKFFFDRLERRETLIYEEESSGYFLFYLFIAFTLLYNYSWEWGRVFEILTKIKTMEKMFRLEEDILYIELPQGQTQAELVSAAKTEIKALIESGAVYGKHIGLNGRLTTGMALMLGHELAHVTKSVSIFDPKENGYVLCIAH